MGWSIGFDSNWKRDIGYGVPAVCDHPDCNEKIDRGLSYVCCGQQPYGGDQGCGLYFCPEHQLGMHGQCERCSRGNAPFDPKPDVPQWMRWKLKDDSWRRWRGNNPDEVEKLRIALKGSAEC